MNVILVIIDSLRADHLGCYGNEWIHTPNLDAFARESVLFTNAHPESLPTLPMRRSTHTGIRTFPFVNHEDYKGDFKGSPGWGPIDESQDTFSELAQKEGFRTCFITDTYHYFKPSKNFHRGFDEWIWVRGQEWDSYRSGPDIPDELVNRHLPEGNSHSGMREFIRAYLRNNIDRKTEEDYYPARLFSEASRWVWNNHNAEKIFLLVDSFDPHEPWDPPVYYRKLYDPDDDCIDVIQSLYDPWRGRLTEREVKRMQANYAGEVTLVDRWFGHFMTTARNCGLLDNCVVAVISDHGHNVGHDPGDKGLISKHGYPMTHAVGDLVLIVRHPEGIGAGTKTDALVYNHDLTATLMNFAGIVPVQPIDGLDFAPVMAGEKEKIRDHVTIGWGASITVIDPKWWYNANIWGDYAVLYDVKGDPHLERNLAEQHPDECERLRKLAVADAGGEIPHDFEKYRKREGDMESLVAHRLYLERPGCTPLQAES